MIQRSAALHKDQRRLFGFTHDTSRDNATRDSFKSVTSNHSDSEASRESPTEANGNGALGAEDGAQAHFLAAAAAAAAARPQPNGAAPLASVTDKVEAIIAAADERLLQASFDVELADRWGAVVKDITVDYQLCSKDRESLELAYTIGNTAPSAAKGETFDSADALHLHIVCAATAAMLELCCESLDPGSIEWDCVFERLSGYFFVRFTERRNTSVHVMHQPQASVEQAAAAATTAATAAAAALPPLGIFAASAESDEHLFVETAAQPIFGPSSSELFVQRNEQTAASATARRKKKGGAGHLTRGSPLSSLSASGEGSHSSAVSSTSAYRHHGFLSPLNTHARADSRAWQSSADNSATMAAAASSSGGFGALSATTLDASIIAGRQSGGAPTSKSRTSALGPPPQQPPSSTPPQPMLFAFPEPSPLDEKGSGLPKTSTGIAALRSATAAEKAWAAAMNSGNAATLGNHRRLNRHESRGKGLMATMGGAANNVHDLSESEVKRLQAYCAEKEVSQLLPEQSAIERALGYPLDNIRGVVHSSSGAEVIHSPSIRDCAANLPEQVDGPDRLRPSAELEAWFAGEQNGHHHHHHHQHHGHHGHKKGHPGGKGKKGKK